MSASRYAMMMLRHAETDGSGWSRPIQYGPGGVV
jgi:hypothetical protein